MPASMVMLGREAAGLALLERVHGLNYNDGNSPYTVGTYQPHIRTNSVEDTEASPQGLCTRTVVP